jgi:hypothetical protein
MVMGLINYPELGESITRIDEELRDFTRRHPYIILKRIFVFNYPFDSTAPPPSPPNDDPDSLNIFPPDGECEGGNMIDVHLHEVMGNAGVKIICALEQQMLLCEEARASGALPAVPLMVSVSLGYHTAHVDQASLCVT